MKNKKLILGGSIILGGGLFAYFFLRKEPTSLSDIKPELKTADNLPIQKDVLETSVVQKDTTKEEFDMYYKTYRDINQKIVKLEKSADWYKYEDKQHDYGDRRRIREINEELTSLRTDLLDYEQKIIDLGYTPTGRGTFVKTGAVKTIGFFKR